MGLLSIATLATALTGSYFAQRKVVDNLVINDFYESKTKVTRSLNNLTVRQKEWGVDGYLTWYDKGADGKLDYLKDSRENYNRKKGEIIYYREGDKLFPELLETYKREIFLKIPQEFRN